ncbi:hypothetical protein [Deinococcus fonticola]|uniref:hypothetical protein n=1 Tax=Deinococcus fonticola TaxID=2528713 RepID=UPI00107547C0|nr:hypothetical protein [Deinococcus fonticola]
MARLDNNLKVDGAWFTWAPLMRLGGSEGGVTIRRTLNGKMVAVALPNQGPGLLECDGGGELIHTKDAIRIYNLWSTRAEFAIEAQGVLPDGQGIKAERCMIVDKPELTYATDGEREGTEYQFTITILY